MSISYFESDYKSRSGSPDGLWRTVHTFPPIKDSRVARWAGVVGTGDERRVF